MFLDRGPDESVDPALREFYGRLLRALADSGLGIGDWTLCETTGWTDNATHEQLLSWCWRAGDTRRLVVINYADAPAQARVRLPWDDLANRTWSLHDALGGGRFDRDGSEIATDGLYVGLDPWQSYLLALS